MPAGSMYRNITSVLPESLGSQGLKSARETEMEFFVGPPEEFLKKSIERVSVPRVEGFILYFHEGCCCTELAGKPFGCQIFG